MPTGGIPCQVWKIKRAGSLERLKLVEDVLPPPGRGQVRICVRAVGLNFADIFACLGLYSATPAGVFVPGLEFAGTVEEMGFDATPFRTGEAVMGVVRFGGYATRLNADVRHLWALPHDWTYTHGAAFITQALTAWYALVELANARSGQVVLLHSAAGGVGLQALAMMRKLGVYAVATVGNPEKARFLKEHAGLAEERIIVRDPKRYPRQLDAALEKANADGFDAILDSIAGEFFRPGYRRLRQGGRLILYGAASMMPPGRSPNYLRLIWQYLRRPRLDPLQMISENKSIMGFNLIWLWERTEMFHRMMEQILELGLSPPHVGARFPFERAPAALRLLQSGSSIGKIVLEALP